MEYSKAQFVTKIVGQELGLGNFLVYLIITRNVKPHL